MYSQYKYSSFIDRKNIQTIKIEFYKHYTVYLRGSVIIQLGKGGRFLRDRKIFTAFYRLTVFIDV